MQSGVLKTGFQKINLLVKKTKLIHQKLIRIKYYLCPGNRFSGFNAVNKNMKSVISLFQGNAQIGADEELRYVITPIASLLAMKVIEIDRIKSISLLIDKRTQI